MDTYINTEVARAYDPYWIGTGTPSFACNEGWLGILADLAQKFGTATQDVHVRRVLQASGVLLVDASSMDPQVQEWVTAAAKESESVCEVCGNPGKLGFTHNIVNWWLVRCDIDKPEGWVAAPAAP